MNDMRDTHYLSFLFFSLMSIKENKLKFRQPKKRAYDRKLSCNANGKMEMAFAPESEDNSHLRFESLCKEVSLADQNHLV